MVLLQCNINAVRNLNAVSFELSPGFNVFYGQNGSGKTSVLEAVYMLGHNKSFRHHSIQPVICHDAAALSVFVKVKQQGFIHAVGIEKTREGKTTLRLDGENALTPAQLAELFPLQLIHPDSDELLTGSPKLRRQFMDWGMFHVEHSFLELWQSWQRVLKQRNAALKSGLNYEQVSSWDQEYIKTSEKISEWRRWYLAEVAARFDVIIKDFLPEFELALSYQRGWSEKEPLEAQLLRNYYRDMAVKYTQYGPQRDELNVLCNGVKASEMLSRGEQKLVVVALRLAQGLVLKELKDRACLYLLDDFAAELDSEHRLRVIERLVSFKSQVLLTTIDYEEVKACVHFANPSLFHVEHGAINGV